MSIAHKDKIDAINKEIIRLQSAMLGADENREIIDQNAERDSIISMVDNLQVKLDLMVDKETPQDELKSELVEVITLCKSTLSSESIIHMDDSLFSKLSYLLSSSKRLLEL